MRTKIAFVLALLAFSGFSAERRGEEKGFEVQPELSPAALPEVSPGAQLPASPTASPEVLPGAQLPAPPAAPEPPSPAAKPFWKKILPIRSTGKEEKTAPVIDALVNPEDDEKTEEIEEGDVLEKKTLKEMQEMAYRNSQALKDLAFKMKETRTEQLPDLRSSTRHNIMDSKYEDRNQSSVFLEWSLTDHRTRRLEMNRLDKKRSYIKTAIHRQVEHLRTQALFFREQAWRYSNFDYSLFDNLKDTAEGEAKIQAVIRKEELRVRYEALAADMRTKEIEQTNTLKNVLMGDNSFLDSTDYFR